MTYILLNCLVSAAAAECCKVLQIKKKVDNIDALVAWGIDHGKMRKHSLVVEAELFRRPAGKAELPQVAPPPPCMSNGFIVLLVEH